MDDHDHDHDHDHQKLPGVRTRVVVSCRRVGPGLLLAGAAVAVSFGVSRVLAGLNPVTIALFLGLAVGNTPVTIDRYRPGLAVAGRRILRVGIVLLGLRLVLGDVLLLGAGGLAVVVVVVLVTFFGTQWLGQKLGLSPGTSLLVATGFSVCGVSAVAAMDAVTRNRREDAATAVALVTLFGTLAMLVMPLLQAPLGLSDTAYGTWVGASVHDVAQTVAAASPAGSTALAAAVVVKLTRVVMLAPMVAGVSLWQRRRTPRTDAAARPPLVPLFVLAFLVAVLLRSTGILPDSVVAAAQDLSTLALAAALFALGTSVRLRGLVATGGRALGLGLVSWVVICVLAYAGVHILGL